MYHSGHLSILLLTAAMTLPGAVAGHAQTPNSPSPLLISKSTQEPQANGLTTIHLRWGARPAVSRYRLQLAGDREFHDIVFDRVVTGNEYRITDLSPGKYFWRVAPLTAKLGEFSSAAAIEVTPNPAKSNAQIQPLKNKSDRGLPGDSSGPTPPSNAIRAGGGWRAAVGEITDPVAAHLRSRDRVDLVAVNSQGITYALDANSGVALWSSRRGIRDPKVARPGVNRIPPLPIKTRSDLDDIVIISGVTVIRLEGTTGRELWRATLPSLANTAAVLPEKRGSKIFVVDNSLQTLFVVDGNAGNIIGQVRLARRVVGAPAAFDDRGLARMMFAFDSGLIEVRDSAGAIVRSGEAGSPATTPPLFVNGSRAGLILVGTRSGLTAMSAEDLRPLGRVSLNGDAPRGTLAAADLNADGAAEVIVFTDRGRVEAVNAADGKLLWENAGGRDAETAAFADINADGTLDVLITGGQTFALALSGRDGTTIWQDDEAPASVANHSVSLASRRLVTIRSGSGVLLIAGDSSRIGLRAIEFSNRTTKQ